MNSFSFFLSENINREIGNIKMETENIKENQREMRNTITEMKNTLGETNGRLDEAGDWISDLKDTTIENIQLEQQQKKRIPKTEE